MNIHSAFSERLRLSRTSLAQNLAKQKEVRKKFWKLSKVVSQTEHSPKKPNFSTSRFSLRSEILSREKTSRQEQIPQMQQLQTTGFVPRLGKKSNYDSVNQYAGMLRKLIRESQCYEDREAKLRVIDQVFYKGKWDKTVRKISK